MRLPTRLTVLSTYKLVGFDILLLDFYVIVLVGEISRKKCKHSLPVHCVPRPSCADWNYTANEPTYNADATRFGSYHEICVLSSWHLMIEDTRVRCTDISLEAAVKHANLTPVRVQCLNISIADTRAQFCLLERRTDRSHRRLRS